MVATFAGLAAGVVLAAGAAGPHEHGSRDWSLELSLDAQLEHNDNVFLDREDRVEDEYALVRPSVVFGLKRRQYNVRVGYEPAGYFHRDRKELDEFYHNVFASFDTGLRHFKLKANAGYRAEVRRFGTPEDIRTDLIRTRTFDISPYYQLQREKTRLVAGVRLGDVDTEADPDIVIATDGPLPETGDYRYYQAFGNFEWSAQPKVTLTSQGAAGYTDFRSPNAEVAAGDLTTVYWRGGVRWQPRWRLTLEGFAGVQWLDSQDSDSGSSSFEIFGGSMGLKIGRDALLDVAGQRQVTQDVFGNPIVDHGVTASLTWDVHPRWGILGRGSWQQYEYTSDTLAILDDEIYGGQLQLEYRPADLMTFNAEVIHFRNRGRTTANDYDVTRVRGGVLLRFDLPRARRQPRPSREP